MEEEFIRNQERLKPQEEKIEEERSKVSKYILQKCQVLGPYFSPPYNFSLFLDEYFNIVRMCVHFRLTTLGALQCLLVT